MDTAQPTKGDNMATTKSIPVVIVRDTVKIENVTILCNAGCFDHAAKIAGTMRSWDFEECFSSMAFPSMFDAICGAMNLTAESKAYSKARVAKRIERVAK